SPVLSEEATVATGDTEIAAVQIIGPEEGRIYIHVQKYGTTEMTITDGDKEYSYTVTVYNDKGIARVQIDPAE
ncbi:MAG: pilus assembly protein N-terminal domain-containing protein, partial [Erysipelotrichaceae bacterium]|nr:pilus assembly protein N-terminal domain-containing protein [Erysipelotrichaceae bacterium]